jgi:hypothetical protein
MAEQADDELQALAKTTFTEAEMDEVLAGVRVAWAAVNAMMADPANAVGMASLVAAVRETPDEVLGEMGDAVKEVVNEVAFLAVALRLLRRTVPESVQWPPTWQPA